MDNAVQSYFNSVCCNGVSDTGCIPPVIVNAPIVVQKDSSGNIQFNVIITNGTPAFSVAVGGGFPAWLSYTVTGNIVSFYNNAPVATGVYAIPFAVVNGCGAGVFTSNLTVNAAPCVLPTVDLFGPADEIIPPFEPRTGNILVISAMSTYVSVTIDGPGPFVFTPLAGFPPVGFFVQSTIIGNVLTFQLWNQFAPLPIGTYPISFKVSNACGDWIYNGNFKIVR